MLKPIYTRQFAKDLKKMQRRGKSPKKIKKIMSALINGNRLDAKHRDHKLIGYYKDRRECHVEADWLLIYKATENEIIFERTGTHSDLFE